MDNDAKSDTATADSPASLGSTTGDYRANFLWPHDKGTIEEAGYEFANGRTEAYRKWWWEILLERSRSNNN